MPYWRERSNAPRAGVIVLSKNARDRSVKIDTLVASFPAASVSLSISQVSKKSDWIDVAENPESLAPCYSWPPSQNRVV